MADPAALDDVDAEQPSATPLDLLLNAISDSGTGGLPPAVFDPAADSHDASLASLDDHARADAGGRKRPLDDDEAIQRQSKVARTFLSHVAASDAVSTVHVWHPRTAQKSYGKERRMINPPPTVRVTGPLFAALTSATLSASTASGGVSSTQAHDVPLVPGDGAAGAAPPFKTTRKGHVRQAAYRAGWGGTLPWERRRVAAKERQALADGLSFPGLWVGDTKDKEFALELKLGVPDELRDAALDAAEQVKGEGEPAEQGPPPPLDEDALRHVLGEAGVEIDPISIEARLAEHFAAAGPAETPPTAALPHSPAPPTPQASGAPWATLASPSLTIVSKPSQKTAKARSMDSCLSTTDAVALWVRVHGQTVRTKYLFSSGEAGLQSRTGKWTPFRFEVLARAARQEPAADAAGTVRPPRYRADDTDVVTYGSVVRLVDAESGARSAPVKLVRVDKNAVAVAPADDGNPVSELQRVGFVRVAGDARGWVEEVGDAGARLYLAAPGAVAGAAEVKTKRARPSAAASRARAEQTADDDGTPAEGELPETLGEHEAAVVLPSQPGSRPHKVKTKRHALAKATIAEEAEGSTAGALKWAQAARRDLDTGEIVEDVDDWMCWVIGAVSSFSYSFFDTVSGHLPTAPLGPVPRLLAPPVFQAETGTLELTLSDFFVPDTLDSGRRAYDVYLGPLGPLRAEPWRSTAVRATHAAGVPAEPLDAGAAAHARRKVSSAFPRHVPHVIAVVDVPSADDILRAMHAGAGAEAEAGFAAAPPAPAPDASAGHEADAWLGGVGGDGAEDVAALAAHEMTIQDALRRAGDELGVDVGAGAGGVDDHDFLLDPALAAPAVGAAPGHDDREDGPGAEQDDLDGDLGLFMPEDRGDADASAAAPAAGQYDAALPGQADARAAAAAADTPALRMEPAPAPAPRAGQDTAELALLLVRPDGAGLDLGWRVVGERLAAQAGARWGLRVVARDT